MRTYEVFLKKAGKDPFEHAGSLDAPDDELAAVWARETYARRAEGTEMWLVARHHLIALDEAFTGPNADKPYRHNDGRHVAQRRRELRRNAGASGNTSSGTTTNTASPEVGS